MNFKTAIKTLLISSAAMAVCSCSEDKFGFNYTDGIVTDQLADTVVVNDDAIMEINSPLAQTDRIVAVSQDSHEEIYLDWGYSYIGADENGNRQYDTNRSFAKITFDDKWNCGLWNVYAENGTERRKLGTTNFVVVKTMPDSLLDATETFKGVVKVAADGWVGSSTDKFDFYNKDTKAIVYTISSTIEGSNPNFNYSDVSFHRDSLSTGNYTLKVRRWEYGFTQDLGDFYYFRLALVDTLDITKDETGKYYIDFHLDKVLEGDQLTAAYDTGKSANYKETLNDKFFDTDKQIYRSYIPDNKVYPGKSYSLSLRRNGTNLSLSGSKLLPDTAETE